MATQYNILERYGIKEVADVAFIDIETNRPVLYLDSLTVSTIEETAENTEARGGKGNAPLLSWDYGKEINVTITDALYSPKSLTLMHSQNLSDLHVYNAGDPDSDFKSEQLPVVKYKNFYVTSTGTIDGSDLTKPTNASSNKSVADYYVSEAAATGASAEAITNKKDTVIKFLTNIGVDAKVAEKIVPFEDKKNNANVYTYIKVYRAEDNALYGEAASIKDDSSTYNFTFNEIKNGQGYIVEYRTAPAHKSRLVVRADSFPGTYKVVGDTYARNNRTGKDDYFQFVIHKAKVNPENTFSFEAEGDATVFDMSLRVLRPNNGIMMELIQYDFTEIEAAGTGNAVNVHYKKDDEDLEKLYGLAEEAGANATADGTTP